MDPSKQSSAITPSLRLRCESWREFVDHYATDIGKGGLYVPTHDTPPVLSMLDVHLQLPEAIEIVLRARVVQVVQAEAAAAAGKAPGIGLELLEMDGERKRQVSQLIEFARWQGTTGDPNASFARTLLELSPSLPPSEVGYRLSMLPGAGARLSAANALPVIPRLSEPAIKRIEPTRSLDDRAPSVPLKMSASRPSMRAPSSPSLQPPSAAGAPAPQQPPRPSDPVKLRLLLTEFAHKHYEAALRITREMLEGNPGDPQALRWQHMCNARLALGRNDEAAAADHYERALPHDEDNREARDFVTSHRRNKKLNSLPFGRYFVKKK